MRRYRQRKDRINRFRDFVFRSFLEDGEKLLEVAHVHVLIFFKAAFKVIILGMLAPLLFYFAFPEYWYLFGLWGLVGIGGLVYHFIDWYYDVWLLTNIGVIDVERRGFFDITATRIDYHMIEGISYTIAGFWKTIFKFGDLTIDKLGAQTAVILENASRPKKLERLVMTLHDKYVSNRSIRDHHTLKDMLAEMIAYHVHNDKIDSE